MIRNEFDEESRRQMRYKEDVEKIMQEAVKANKMMVVILFVMVGFLIGCIFGIYYFW